MEQGKSKPFEIGLVGAGAISAGAYTGGVVDFLAYALDTWYEAKASGSPAAPPHEVQLSAFSGASAGAITAALATAYFGSDQPPIATPQAAKALVGQNKLYDCWVERIDIQYLLESRDLSEQGNPVISLLDSTILTDIADRGLNVTAREKRRAYVAPNFELLMTVTNLRGVPYNFDINTGSKASYDMSLHADYVHFRINEHGDGQSPDRYSMRWSDFGQSSVTKDKMKVSALASGAFPIGLAPRVLDHHIAPSPDWYSARTWPVPTPHTEHPHACVSQLSIPASFPSPPFNYSFQCVDGGVMNNEPFELARKQLAGPNGSNARESHLADKAVLMIDPFPSDTSFDQAYQAAPDLLGSAMKLFGALKNQARFKPDELMLAARTDVASRYMIAPSRDGKTYPIASGSLGGFGGFLKRDFRSHDYFLARRNAQKFFRDHFVLNEDNELFKAWTDDLRKEHCVKDSSGNPVIRDGRRLLPVIPLIGEAARECAMPEWPQYTSNDMDGLMQQAELRLTAVSQRLVDQYFKKNWVLGPAVKLIIWARRKDILAKIRGIVTRELQKMELIKT